MSERKVRGIKNAIRWNFARLGRRIYNRPEFNFDCFGITSDQRIHVCVVPDISSLLKRYTRRVAVFFLSNVVSIFHGRR